MSLRGEVLEWFADGRVVHGQERAMLQAANMTPTREQWRVFLGRLSQWLGVLALAAAVIFFFAYNWDALGRLGKIGLAEGAIVAGLLACWRVDLNGTAGKATLTFLSLLVGALLALIGQVYQTGADSFELFAWWTALILPWVVIGRFAPLWLLWLGLLQVAVSLYLSLPGRGETVLWCLFALNVLALVAWEAGRSAGIAWMRESWPPRLIAIAGAASATALIVSEVFDRHAGAAAIVTAAYLVWLAATYYWYRRVRLDLLMLAAGLLSLIVGAAALLSRHMLDFDSAGGFLIVGLVVIGMSAVGAIWLKSAAQETGA